MRISIILLLSLFFLTSCVPSRTIEDLGIINIRGNDLSDDGLVETTLVIFKFTSDKKEVARIVTGKANTVKNAREDANRKTRFQLSPGAIHVELYGNEIAEKGLMRFIDPIVRDARVSDSMYLAISDTTAKEILESAKKNPEININRYFHDVIGQSIKSNVLPRITLQDFLHFYYDVGLDPILPVFSIVENKPILTSLAILKNDKMVGQIPLNDAYLINMFHQSVKEANFEVTIPLEPFKKNWQSPAKDAYNGDKFFALYKILNGKSKIIPLDMQEMHFRVEVNLELALLELSKSILMNNAKIVQILEKETEKELKKKYKDLFIKVQKMGADPFGFGEVYRINKPSGKLKRKEWHDKFPEIKVDFQVHAKITHKGMTP